MENAGGNPPPPAGERKMSKRGREMDGERDPQDKAAEVLLEMVNDEGVLIDFTALKRGGDDVYNEELRRRTAGMESEEELLRFMESLNGDWCSRKQKRMCVDAREFGDVLPIGWKVVLALKRRRRDGRPVPYFLRYISPNGEQFPSCKEVACFLQSQFLSLSANQDVAVLHEEEDDGLNLAIVPYQNVDVLHEEEDDCLNRAIVPYQNVDVLHEEDDGGVNLAMVPYQNVDVLHEEDDGGVNLAMVPYQNVDVLHEGEDCGVNFAIVPYSSQPTETGGKELQIWSEGTDNNLVDVQIQDHYDCGICKMRFDEHTDYARHLTSFHRNTARRYRRRPPLTDGVIMKDGKYECQFCHKVFDKKLSYTGHIGIHLRRNIKGSAAAEIAPNTVSQTPPVVQKKALLDNIDLNLMPTQHMDTDKEDDELANLRLLCDVSTRCCENPELIGNMINDEEDDQLANLRLLSDVSARYCENPELIGNMINDEEEDELANLRLLSDVSARCCEHPELIGNMANNTIAAEENVSKKRKTASSFSVPQALNKLARLASELNKKRGESSNEAGSFKGPSLAGASVGVANHETDKEEAVKNAPHHHTAVCVWCTKEFSLQVVASQTPADATGYMCSDCKTKIAGLNGGTSHS